jgi:hypothetical protein
VPKKPPPHNSADPGLAEAFLPAKSRVQAGFRARKGVGTLYGLRLEPVGKPASFFHVTVFTEGFGYGTSSAWIMPQRWLAEIIIQTYPKKEPLQ